MSSLPRPIGGPFSADIGTFAENVITRLRRRTRHAQKLGYEVRTVPLDGAEPSWCQIGSRRVILLDLGQPAAEQLQHLEEILAVAESPRMVPALDR